MDILVAEEDSGRGSLLESWLRGWGHRVTVLNSAQEAQDCLARTTFDLVILNWDLSQPSSLVLCRMSRKSLNYRYQYIILYSWERGSLDVAAALDAGADDVVTNAVEFARFGVRIRVAERVLNLQRKLREQNAELERLNEKLSQAYGSIKADLQSASALQFSLLPSKSDVHPSFRLDWMILPSSFLAGDNLNYFLMQERYIVFYHLDVSGHGVASALLSATLNHLLSPQPGSPMVRFDPQLELKRIVPPVDVVMELNRRFQSQGDSYFTMIYGILDTETHEVRFCQAGHPCPLKVLQNGTVSAAGDGGFPVGLWPNMTYDDTVLTLLPGEKLVLYSDGILESTNHAGLRYPLERFKDLLSRHARASSKELLRVAQADFDVWRQGRESPDDISMLIIEGLEH